MDTSRFKRSILSLVAAIIMACVWQPASAAASPGTAVAAPVVLHVAASKTAADTFKTSWSWYVARASGIIATILLALLIMSGVGMLTGLTYKALEPLPAWALHRALGLSFGVMVVVHMLVLLFDKFIGFSIADVLIPFASDYKPVTVGGVELGSFYVATGVLAFYAVVAVIVSSLLWMQSRPKPWKLLHFFSYAILALVFVHGLFLGTDLKQGIGRWLWIIGGVLLLVAIIPRLRRMRTIGGGA